MKLTRCKKIFLIIAIAAFVVLLFGSDTAFAAINTEYSSVDSVSDNFLDDAFNNSSLLDLLARLIFAVGRFLEWILGIIFKMLTGSSDFPWADKIVFNSVPLLDVNFINPDGQSFVGNGAIKGVLKNTYATVLTLAASFFGIVVLITAIKLVISTIASEKAKYKQAIVDWLVGFVMLFCIHYAISFIFYLNEQLVVVASKIVTEQLSEADRIAQVQASELTNQLIDSMGDTIYTGTYRGKRNVPIKNILKDNTNIVQAFINLDSGEDSHGLQEFLQKGMSIFGWDASIGDDNQKQRLADIVVWASSVNVSVSELQNIRKYEIFPVTENSLLDILIEGTGREGQAITKANFDKIFYGVANRMRINLSSKNNLMPDLKTNQTLVQPNYNDEAVGQKWLGLAADTELYMTFGFDEIGSLDGWALAGDIIGYAGTNIALSLIPGVGTFLVPINAIKDLLGYDYDTSYKWTTVLDDLIRVKSASATSGCSIRDTGDKKARCNDIASGTTTATTNAQRIISDLATYFRENAMAKEFRDENISGLKDTGAISIQNMIMYSVLVAQSLILFIAYIKRLFYVILLAMMAPIVVVFDFFQKFGK